MKLSTVVPASEFSELQVRKRILKGIIGASLSFLQRTFGSQIMLEIPPYLQNSSLENLKMIRTANKLRELGIIKYASKKHKLPDEPLLHQYYVITNGSLNGYGSNFLSEEAAFWKALARGTERYLWTSSNEFYKKEIRFSSFEKLSGKALDIFSLVGFSEKQKEEDESLKFDSKTVFGWIKAESIVSGSSIYCPAQLASLLYENEIKDSGSDKTNEVPKVSKEPLLRQSDISGLATGKTLEEAILNGFLEIIEKDAFMLTYLNKISAPRINLEHLKFQDNDIRNILNRIERYDLEITLLDIPTDFPVNAIACVIIDKTGKGPAFSIGISARFNPKQAIINAASEALSMRLSMKNNYNNADASKNEYQERLAFWAQEKNLTKIGFLTNGSEIEINLNNNKNFFIKNRKKESDENIHRNNIKKIGNYFKKMGYEACYVKLSTKKVEKLGFYCVKAISPELQPANASKKIPYLESKRLRKTLEDLGYKPAETLNQEIHPLI